MVISTISLGCSFVFKVTPLQAQTDTLVKTLNEVTVHEEGVPETQNLATTLLQVRITKSEIERVPIQSLNDLLDRLQGLDIRQRGILNTQSDISYRGGNFDQTLILLNGFNMTDPQTGHYALNLPIPPDIINKIELFNNTTAFLYGTSPFSGLVNVITRPDTTNSLSLHLAGGMFGWLTTSAALNFKTGKFAHLLSVDYSRSDGYKHNTDFEVANVFYQNVARFKTGELEMQAGYSGREYGANGFYSLKYPDQYETVHTFFAGIRWKHVGKVFWTPSFYYRGNVDKFELVKNQLASKNNYHFNQAAGFNFLAYFFTVAGKTSFNADVRVENILSTSLGRHIAEPLPILYDTIQYRNFLLNLNSSISASQHYEKKGFIADLTLLFQHFSHLPKKAYLLPAGYLSYKISPKAVHNSFISSTFYLSGGMTMRMPTFTDLYYKTGDILGNDQLLPEKATTLEVGADLQLSKYDKPAYLTVSVSYFNRWGRDMIDYVKKDSDIVWRTINYTDITFYGIEGSIAYRPNFHYRDNFFITYIGLDYAYLHSDKESKGYQSRYVLDHLTHKLTFRLSHKIVKGLQLDYAFSWNKRKGEYTSYTTNPAGVLQPYPTCYLLDIRLSYSYKMLLFYVEASNVLNQKYFDLGDLEQPGVWIRGGIKCKLKI
jgi:iron complex outermembrane receptor protein